MKGEPRPSPRVMALVSEAAGTLGRRESEIARGMTDLIARDVEHLDEDESLLELLHASVDANVTTIIHVLLNGIPVERIQPSTAATEYALRLAQRDIPANSLVRAYSVGKDDMVHQCFPAVQGLGCTPEERLEVLRYMTWIVAYYVDTITQRVFAAYEEEAQRWASARGNLHATLVHDLLSSRGADPRVFERDTGYRLDRHHLGVVAWSTDPLADALLPLEHLVSRLGTALHASGRPLVTAADRSTAWAWIPFGATPQAVDVALLSKLVAETPTYRLSVGLPAPGVAGFRRSHAQALAARRVAVTPGNAARVVSFGDEGVAITSLLANDLESTRAWVAEVLGALAADDEATESRRETLRAFLMTGGSYTETAEQMSLHRNTVKYRVTKALESLNPEVSANRMDLAVALNVCHYLGAVALRPQ